MAWLTPVLLPIPICLLPFLLLLFPTGHLPPRVAGWRPVAWLSAAVLLFLTFSGAVFRRRFWADPFAGSQEAVADSVPRYALAVFLVAAVAYPVAMLLSFASVVVQVPPLDRRRAPAAEVVRGGGRRRGRHVQPRVLL